MEAWRSEARDGAADVGDVEKLVLEREVLCGDGEESIGQVLHSGGSRMVEEENDLGGGWRTMPVSNTERTTTRTKCFGGDERREQIVVVVLREEV